MLRVGVRVRVRVSMRVEVRVKGWVKVCVMGRGNLFIFLAFGLGLG